MNRTVQGLVVLAVGLGYAAAAHAYSHNWGSLEDALKCEKEVEASTPGWDSKKYDNKYMSKAFKAGTLSPDCKAEFEKRAALCLKDPQMRSDFEYADQHKISHEDYCADSVGGNLWTLVYNDHSKKAQAAEEAQAKEAEKAKQAAKVAAVEVPKPEMKDPKLEKLVADAFHRDYPEGKVLKVVLGKWAEDLEKDDFGRVIGRDLQATVINVQPDGKCQLHDELWMQHGKGRSFSGPLSARGAGSAINQEILCSKLEGLASAGGGKKKK